MIHELVESRGALQFSPPSAAILPVRSVACPSGENATSACVVRRSNRSGHDLPGATLNVFTTTLALASSSPTVGPPKHQPVPSVIVTPMSRLLASVTV